MKKDFFINKFVFLLLIFSFLNLNAGGDSSFFSGFAGAATGSIISGAMQKSHASGSSSRDIDRLYETSNKIIDMINVLNEKVQGISLKLNSFDSRIKRIERRLERRLKRKREEIDSFEGEDTGYVSKAKQRKTR